MTHARRTWSSAVLFCAAAVGCGADANNSQAQSPLSPTGAPSSVIIAAVELQFEDPSPGGQSVWLANRGTREQDISCWRISATSSGVTAFVSDATRLAPGRALRFSTPARMLRSPEVVTLADRSGGLVARTPELIDSAGDDQAWYLLPGESWRFGRSRLPETTTDGRLAAAC